MSTVVVAQFQKVVCIECGHEGHLPSGKKQGTCSVCLTTSMIDAHEGVTTEQGRRDAERRRGARRRERARAEAQERARTAQAEVVAQDPANSYKDGELK